MRHPPTEFLKCKPDHAVTSQLMQGEWLHGVNKRQRFALNQNNNAMVRCRHNPFFFSISEIQCCKFSRFVIYCNSI